jgi:hypothetical protein
LNQIIALTLINMPAGLYLACIYVFFSLLAYTALRATLVYNESIYSVLSHDVITGFDCISHSHEFVCLLERPEYYKQHYGHFSKSSS